MSVSASVACVDILDGALDLAEAEQRGESSRVCRAVIVFIPVE